MKIEILNRSKKKKIIEIFKNFGITQIKETLILSGKEKIRAFSGSLDQKEIMAIWKILPIEGIGLYVGKDSFNRKKNTHEIRPTLDGLHTWKKQITNRIIKLTDSQEKEWFSGANIDLSTTQKTEDGFIVVKHNTDFVGVGKVGNCGSTLFGFLPKERRRKERTA